MRKLLLASAATVGASAMMLGGAYAQPATALPASPLSGTYLVTPNGGGGGANNNLNYQGYYTPGNDVAPTPGTMNVHLNFAVWVEASMEGSSADKSNAGNGGAAGSSYKVQPYNMQSYFRIYPGVDAMATNGLKYGANVEIRENWSAQPYNAAQGATAAANAGTGLASSTATGASGPTCTQTLYVRRAFVYFGADRVGIFRFGQGDSSNGSFDNGVTTWQNYDMGNWNGDIPTPIPSNVNPTWPFLAQQGADYGNNKVVYFSPQFAGFDFSATWAPNSFNGENQCGVAGPSCSQLSSSSGTVTGGNTDGARLQNEVQAAARYQGNLGPVGVYAYAAYIGSGHVDYTGAPPTLASAPGGWNGKFNNLSIANVGAVLTIAGVSFGGNYMGGAYNGSGGAQPSGGAPGNSWIVGAQYANGPWTVGISYLNYQAQGSAVLTKISQRYNDEFNVGGTWNAAPGLWFYAEYGWAQMHQGDFNYVQAANLSPLENTVQAQVFVVGTKIRW